MQETSLSLLGAARAGGDADAWRRLADIYTPWLRSWLLRYDISATDADDLVQEVLLTVSQELPTFAPRPHRGAFRGWLRTILVNRLRHFWRSRKNRPQAVGGSDFMQHLDQLEDQATPVSGLWDQEHDRHVMNRLLSLVESQFAAPTWTAFRRQVLDGVPAEGVAAEMNMPLHSVYAAKSRVLKALRTVGEGLV